MRYYEYVLNTSVDAIEKNAKIRLKDFDYDSTIGAVNKYIYKNIITNVQFFIFRADGGALRCVFSYAEDKISHTDAVNAFENLIDEIADISKAGTEQEEITTYQYIDYLLEAKRRGYNISYHYLSESNSFLYESITHSENSTLKNHFILEERIVPLESGVNHPMYDQSMCDELSNIRRHTKSAKHEGNMVHYVISDNSLEAAINMAETLVQNLMKANRLSSRRIEVIREIDPCMYSHSDYFEYVISGNKGGAILIDMTEKFGKDPTNYQLNCKYIDRIVKKYNKECLFIFTYNMKQSGFAYTLLPMLKSHVALVKLREATRTKEEAILYLEELIKSSQYGEYAEQAGEFLKNKRRKQYSQTDVLEAFEQFEPWCINRNIFHAYNCDSEEEFFLDHTEGEESASVKLDKLIGLKKVKEQIHRILLTDMIEKERKSRSESVYRSSTMHMIFSGNPGSAKTTVARLFAEITKEHGILKSGVFVERSGTDYSGLFPANLEKDFEAAKGGVLFIDEAYAIKSELIGTLLIREMENRRDDVIVILAGYNEKMQQFLEINEGLKSRIPYWVDFPDYSSHELLDILEFMASERGFSLTESAKKEANAIFDKACFLENFGNGRFVRNLIEKAIQNQAVRLVNEYNSANQVPEEALFTLIAEDFEATETTTEKREYGAAQKELDEMIGIKSAKQVIQKAVATFKLKKRYMDMNLSKDKPSMHMVFTGNPGTAKTTTARLFAEIMRDEKILPSGKFVELGRADLVGQFVGQTAPLVKQRFQEARGGVLFIDEAYSLCEDGNGYGDEAISTIVQEMENHREDTIVIFAGYPEEMKKFMEKNPGMKSRIAFQVTFDDYSTDELCDIARLMVAKKGMHITEEALSQVRKLCDTVRHDHDYGNGRYVRRILEEAEMNLAQRLYMQEESALDFEVMTTIEACDIEALGKEQKSGFTIGFRAS